MGIIKRCLLFVLFGCTATSPWHVSYLDGTDISRLSYPAHDRVNGIGVEMVCAENSLRTYLEVHSQCVPPYHGNPQEALLTLKVGGQIVQDVAHRHAGGQRVLLSEYLQKTLIDALLEGQPATLGLQGYKVTLSPEQFVQNYKKMKKSPLNIPIQLPFKL